MRIYKKNLGLLLDTTLNFLTHINEKIKKIDKGISVNKNSAYHCHVLH